MSEARKLPPDWRLSTLGTELIRSDKRINPCERPNEEFFYIGLENVASDTGELLDVPTVKGGSIKSVKNAFDSGDILYGKLRPNLNKVHLATRSGICSSDIWVLKAAPTINKEYAAFFLRSPEVLGAVTRFARGANLPRVNASGFDAISVSVPPLAEQNRIVDVLRAANELCRLRRRAHQGAEIVASALFKNMFEPGSPDWPERRIGDIISKLDAGKSMTAKPHPARVGKWGVLKVSAVTLGVFQPLQNKELPDDESPNPAHEVKRGDLVISRANTPELVGACAIVRDTQPKLLLPDKLWRVILPEAAETNVEFLNALFKTPQMRREIGQRATGTSGSMKNISQESFQDIVFRLPSKKLQDDFSRAIQLLMEISDESAASRDKLESLFLSLAARAFSGELTARWRAEQTPLDLPTSVEIAEPTALPASEPEAPPISIPQNIADSERLDPAHSQAERALDPPISIEIEEPTAASTLEPKEPPIIVPQIVADRDRLYTALSQSQRALFDRVAAEPNYFTAEQIAKEDAFNLIGVKRGLQLLAAAGFIVPVSRAVNPSGSQIFYVDSYRMPRTEDDCRQEFEAPMP